MEIRPYGPEDWSFLVEAMDEFQDYLIGIDALGRLRRLPGYGESYSRRLLDSLEGPGGVLLLASVEGQPVGLVAGVIHPQAEENLLECVPTKTGVITELFVRDAYRRRGIGVRLMGEIEKHLAREGCTLLWLEVFAPNDGARRFYRGMGYVERDVMLAKPLSEHVDPA